MKVNLSAGTLPKRKGKRNAMRFLRPVMIFGLTVVLLELLAIYVSLPFSLVLASAILVLIFVALNSGSQ